MTDSEMTFTSYLSTIAWRNDDFVFKVSILKKKMAVVLLKIQVSDPVPF